MTIFLLVNLPDNISKYDLTGILVGHLIFGIALTYLVDWKWLTKIMPKSKTNNK